MMTTPFPFSPRSAFVPPARPDLHRSGQKPAPEAAGPKLSKPQTSEGQFMGEGTAPLYTLLNTRNARGTYAQKAIGREQRRVKAGVVTAPSETEQAQPRTKDIVYFRLRDTDVPLPLGWMLSAAAAKTMREQLRLDDDVVQNGEAMDEILKSLPARLAP